MNPAQLKTLAKDLTQAFPRSPRETLAGYVIAARTLDKCRATLAGTAGEYHFNCPLDQEWLRFAGIDADQFRDYVATGATDDAVAAWIAAHATPRPRSAIIQWNNSLRDRRLSEMPHPLQEFLEDYIPRCVPQHRPVYVWFDVYDLEEKRL